MEIKEISAKIVQIINSEEEEYKQLKKKLHKLFAELEVKKFSKEDDITCLLDLHQQLIKINNRIASYAEAEIASYVLPRIPFSIRIDDENIPEDVVEELHENPADNQREPLKRTALLLKHLKAILASPKDKRKRYKKRIKAAIDLLGRLNAFYKISGLKQILLNYMKDSDAAIQIAALIALEEYTSFSESERLTEDEMNTLEKMIAKTKSRDVAATCCQILIHEGKIDEFSAVLRMDDWKDKNWR